MSLPQFANAGTSWQASLGSVPAAKCQGSDQSISSGSSETPAGRFVHWFQKRLLIFKINHMNRNNLLKHAAEKDDTRLIDTLCIMHRVNPDKNIRTRQCRHSWVSSYPKTTPVMLAIMHNNKNALEALLSCGADANQLGNTFSYLGCKPAFLRRFKTGYGCKVFSYLTPETLAVLQKNKGFDPNRILIESDAFSLRSFFSRSEFTLLHCLIMSVNEHGSALEMFRQLAANEKTDLNKSVCIWTDDFKYLSVPGEWTSSRWDEFFGESAVIFNPVGLAFLFGKREFLECLLKDEHVKLRLDGYGLESMLAIALNLFFRGEFHDFIEPLRAKILESADVRNSLLNSENLTVKGKFLELTTLQPVGELDHSSLMLAQIMTRRHIDYLIMETFSKVLSDD